MKLQVQKCEGRVKTLSLCSVMIGYGITINAVGIGASLGAGMTLWGGIAAMVVGTILLAFMASLSGLMGTRTRVTTDVIWRHVYGFRGGRIPTIIVGASLVLWTFFDCWYVGAAMKGLMSNGNQHIAFALGIVIVFLFSLFGAMKGLDSLSIICNASIPVAIVLFAILTVSVANRGGGIAGMSTYVPEVPMTFAMGVNIVVGHFICCTGLWSDVTAESKTIRGTVLACSAGMIANMAIHFVGQFGVIAMGAFGIDAVANQIGGWLMIVTHLFTIVAVCNTVPCTYHMAALELSSCTPLSHKQWVILAPIIGCLGAFTTEYISSLSFISTWSTVVGCLMSPVVGVSLADYWICKKARIDLDRDLPAFAKTPLISLAVAFICCLVVTLWMPSIPATLVGAGVGFVLHCIIGRSGQTAVTA